MARWRNEDAFDSIVEEAGRKYMVPVSLIKAVIAQESAFKPEAYRAEPQINDASRGLMQVLERTARALGFDQHTDLLFSPEISIDLGTKLLAQNLRQANGNWDVAISAYNAGFSKLRTYDAKRDSAGRAINEDYVKRVKGNWAYFGHGAVPNIIKTLGLIALAWILFRGV